MISGMELERFCSWAEKIGIEFGKRALKSDQLEEIKNAYNKGVEKGIELYEESAKIMADRDVNDFINS